MSSLRCVTVPDNAVDDNHRAFIANRSELNSRHNYSRIGFPAQGKASLFDLVLADSGNICLWLVELSV